MAEPSTLIPNLNEIMEKHAQPEEEVHLEPTEEVHLEPTEEVHLEPTEEVHLETTEENKPSEQQEVQPIVRQQKRKRKERRREQEEEDDEFVSEEAHSLWKKHYAGKGFIGERGFSQLISPFKELIEQRGWEKFCKHYKNGYAAIVREFSPTLLEERKTLFLSEGFGFHMELRR